MNQQHGDSITPPLPLSQLPTADFLPPGELLSIDSQELEFQFELEKQISTTLQLSNNTDHLVAFKVRTTNPNGYTVRPNAGIVLPRSISDVIVTITMRAQNEMPVELQSKDKFLIQSVIAPDGFTPQDINLEMFSKEAGKIVNERKLRVVYVLPQTYPTPVGPDEDSAPKAPASDNGNSNRCADVTRAYVESHEKSFEGELLSTDSQELKFHFELKKQISTTLQLSNKTDHYVAFKVKTTKPKDYSVRPNAGIVLPRSIIDVIVTMQAQKEMPVELQSKGKFLIQSVIAPDGLTPQDINLEMFSKESGNIIKECKLRAVYVLPQQTYSVSVGPDDGSAFKAPASDNGNSNGFADVTDAYLESHEKSFERKNLAEEVEMVLQENRMLRLELEKLRLASSKNEAAGSHTQS